jgi:two-component system, chemotaxis family, response regulator Rcp1
VYLIKEAIGETGLNFSVHVAKDGEQAIRYFDGVDTDPDRRCPALVLLDINLPKKHGGDVLKHMRQSRRCAKALIIAVSTSDSPRDRQMMTELGANGYFHKPSGYEEFMKLGDLIKSALRQRLT